MREGVSFHTFTLPEDHCVWLPLKKLDGGMPESLVRGKVEYLNISVRGVTQLHSGLRDQELTKDCPTYTNFNVS